MDELTPYEAEIAREHFPVPGHPVPAPPERRVPALRRIEAYLRHIDMDLDRSPRLETYMIAAVVFACSLGLGGGYVGGVQMEADRQDDRIEAEFAEADAEFWVLSEAYESAYADEMQERGFSPEEIARAEAANFAEFVGGEERGAELPAPRQAATLEIRDQLKETEARRSVLLRETATD